MLPSNVIFVFFNLLASELSENTSESPDASAVLPDVIAPVFVMLPCTWLLDALLVSVGWTWSSRAYLAEDPTAAVPSMTGSAVAAVYVVSGGTAHDPSFRRYLVVSDPIAIPDFTIFPEAELSTRTSASPDAAVTADAVIAPAFVISPWVWSDAALPVSVG